MRSCNFSHSGQDMKIKDRTKEEGNDLVVQHAVVRCDIKAFGSIVSSES